MATESITVYLLKETVDQPRDALRSELPHEITEHALSAGETTGTVFVSRMPDKEPDWAGLLAPVTQPAVQLRTQGAAAVLVLRASGRWFAITFGYGHTLLRRSVHVRRFGLRAALNAADPAHLRGAQARSFNDTALYTQRQVSRLSGIEALELDTERDLITTMSGALADSTLGRRVEGKDSARITGEFDVSRLASLCSRLLHESEQQIYKRHYPWIGNVEEVTDADELERLSNRAGIKLGERHFESFDLFPPELMPAEVVRFRTFPSEGGLVVIEPDTSLLRYPIRQQTDGDTARRSLERYKLIGLDSNGEEVRRWSFWECLHYELREHDQTLVLDEGAWYRVDKRLVSKVERFIDRLGPAELSLPLARLEETEAEYNTRAAKSAGMALLDQKLIRLTGQSPVEPCDLFSAEGHFIHIKRRKGGSGPLSHLCAQALVSAECLLNDEPEFRQKLRSSLETFGRGFSSLVKEPPSAKDTPIVLGLITKPSTTGFPAKELPFFSKVQLRVIVRRLEQMQFPVFVNEIPVQLAVS